MDGDVRRRLSEFKYDGTPWDAVFVFIGKLGLSSASSLLSLELQEYFASAWISKELFHRLIKMPISYLFQTLYTFLLQFNVYEMRQL